MFHIYTVENFLTDLTGYLENIKAYFPFIASGKKNIDVIITPQTIFEQTVLNKILETLNILCDEKILYLEELNTPQPSVDESSYSETEYLLIALQRRESELLNSTDLEQSAINLYHLLKSVCCKMSASFLLPTDIAERDISITLININGIAKVFKDLLYKIADNVEALPSPIRSPFFSAKYYLDKLESNYEKKSRAAYGLIYYFYCFFVRQSERLEEVAFIMQVNQHIAATDSIRIGLMYATSERIRHDELSSSKNTSTLKKIMDDGLGRAIERPSQSNFSSINLFCRTQQINPPNKLGNYVRQQNYSFSFNKMYS